MNNPPLLTAQHLSREFAGRAAVQDLSFELSRGQVLGFLGQNGAGKSTAMRMLTGTLAPSAGKVEICGVDLQEEPLLAKARLGYLPEQPPLYRELTVSEYLAHCGRLKRLPKKRLAGAINYACERCGLEGSKRRLIGNLSKGQQQRVGIAQAIIADPMVVVLDEPTVGLDPVQIRAIRTLITDLGRDRGVILSSHILAEIQAVCSDVLVIAEGRSVLSAPLNELISSENLQVRLALRRPPELEELRGIPGIQDVVALGSGRFRLSCGDNDVPLEKLAEICYRENWGLHELYREEQSLEQLFVELTMSTERQPV